MKSSYNYYNINYSIFDNTSYLFKPLIYTRNNFSASFICYLLASSELIVGYFSNGIKVDVNFREYWEFDYFNRKVVEF